MHTQAQAPLNYAKAFKWISALTLMVLLIPLIAMQFTNEVNWQLGDFIVMGALVFGLASGFTLVTRQMPHKSKVITAVAFFAAFVLIWVELAVGIFTPFGQ